MMGCFQCSGMIKDSRTSSPIGHAVEVDQKVETFGFGSTQFMDVAVAINGKKNSKNVVRWALDKFGADGSVSFKLLYVRPKTKGVPTPMGNYIPISLVREDVAAAYRKDVELQTSKKLSPYNDMFAQKKTLVDILTIESEDVAKAIAEEISSECIRILVIGASLHYIFARKRQYLSSRIAECIPSSCTVYAVSKGKLLLVRPSDSEKIANPGNKISDAASSVNSTSDINFSIHRQNSVRSLHTDQYSIALYHHGNSLSLPKRILSRTLLPAKANSVGSALCRTRSVDIKEEDNAENYSQYYSERGLVISQGSTCSNLSISNQPWISDPAPIADSPTVSASENQDAEKLRGSPSKPDMIGESERREEEKCETMKIDVAGIRNHAGTEADDRREAGTEAFHDEIEKQNYQKAIACTTVKPLNFTWKEIEAATSCFSEHLIIARDVNGTVYRGSFQGTIAAVKIFNSEGHHGAKQFHRELEILSKMKHPHVLVLLGACPDHFCLVYEYMENGSLADRLQCKNNTEPIPWKMRFRIAWEIASALVYLHNIQPKPIVHRDLKPSSILIDHKFVSKIGDVGFSTILHENPSLMSLMYYEYGPIGTVCYIDPEYQRTGLISSESDVYAYGMVILQLLTGRKAMGLVHTVERAIGDGNFERILDSKAGNWPMEEAIELATLALSCAEIYRIDRPNLKDEVLPKVEKLKDSAAKANELMDEPCVAADGNSHEQIAIENWLEENESPQRQTYHQILHLFLQLMSGRAKEDDALICDCIMQLVVATFSPLTKGALIIKSG